MIEVAFKGDETIIKSNQHVYQWDTGQKIMVSGLGDSNINQVHFSFNGLKTAYPVNVTNSSGTVTVNIPNIVLRYGKDVYMYLCIKNTNGTVVTIKTVIIPVIKRNMPENYMYDDNETVAVKLDELQTEIHRSTAVDTEHETRITSLEEAKTNADGEAFETLKGRIDYDVTDLKSDLNDKFSERTSQLLDKNNADVRNSYIDVGSNVQALKSNAGCRTVIIPVSSEIGTKITVYKPVSSTFRVATFTTATPENNTTYATQVNGTGLNSVSVTIDSTIKSIAVWYYYNENDESVTPEEILDSMMINYGSYGGYEPYKTIKGMERVQRYYNSPSHNTRDMAYLSNSIAFISGDITDGPTERGNYTLRSEVIHDDATSKYIYQTAYTRLNDGSTKLYCRYLIYTKATGSFNYDGLEVWKEIGGNGITDVDLSKTDRVEKIINLTDYNSGTANGILYVSNHLYNSGYIKDIKTVVGETSKSVNLYIINPADGTIIRKYTATGSGTITAEINEFIGLDFYLGIQGETNFKDKNYGSFAEEPTLNYFTVSNSAMAGISEGDAITVDFPTRSTSDKVYILAQQITFDSLYAEVKGVENKIVTNNHMFAAGDSITAGHPSYRDGEHWWECVGRTFDYKVTMGARNGSGMSYYNGTNACKIANTTDFKPYNLAVFAFGTNDYGNDIPIGTINDTYTYKEDSSQTFYAACKYVIQTVKQSNPNCVLIMSLPINRTKRTIADNVTGDQYCGSVDTKWAYGATNNAGFTLNDYCEAIIAVCEKYGIPYVDHRNGAFDVFSVSTLLQDGLHPTVRGYKVLGQEMSAKIGSVIRPYVENI